ncbi:hypothetical protein [Permianibacter aggregans]|uniref:DUF4124 domain-containing protein n=1 Tax=Permianibacter aggregans TaxID=1510150 RepID=A0A4R6UWT7_9GAMM|nr:hypothetical protein [Permianibacter aggregans]QGX40985.1 hypothetical protein E2H98_15455 [Permianibacter aggregans]TDQ48044.1 hypothetical protein EV696_10824 [Permianibacter aggregans]
MPIILIAVALMMWSLPAAASDNRVRPSDCVVDGANVVANTPCQRAKPSITAGATVSYQCNTKNGLVFQQTPCNVGEEIIHVYRDNRNAASGLAAQQSIVDALNQLTKHNPTASGSRHITIIGRPPPAEDGKADGYRKVDRSPKASSF